MVQTTIIHFMYSCRHFYILIIYNTLYNNAGANNCTYHSNSINPSKLLTFVAKLFLVVIPTVARNTGPIFKT